MARSRVEDPEELLASASSGDRAALARLLSIVERGGDSARAVARSVFPRSGRAHTVGITGAPGAGKSTLTNALCSVVRSQGDDIAVLAIDPSSPFSGGAILGDRVRMGDHTLDDGVYIRSMATRGHLGGLALATPEAARVLDAVGYGWVVIETVGVGQVEVEVAGAADTTVVVVNPGWGDAVQANKAGLMEIADVFVVNKADRPGAADTRRDLESMLSLGAHRDHTPPILETVATTGAGVEELWRAVQDHRRHLVDSGELAARRVVQADDELRQVVAARLLERAAALCRGERWESARAAVADRALDPWAASGAGARRAGRLNPGTTEPRNDLTSVGAAGAEPDEVQPVVLHLEPRRAGHLGERTIERRLERVGRREVLDPPAVGADQVVVVRGEVLGQFVVAELVADGDPVHDAGGDQLVEVSIGAALGQGVVSLHDLGDREGPVGLVEHGDHPSARRRVPQSGAPEPLRSGGVQVGAVGIGGVGSGGHVRSVVGMPGNRSRRIS